MLLIPRSSEKAYALAQMGTYIFNVPIKANKAQVIAAVKDQYQVSPTDVRLVIMNGKPVRFSRGKRANPGLTNRSDTKKAYVTLAKGDTIANFIDTDDSSEESK